jgi:hypothetical protein
MLNAGTYTAVNLDGLAVAAPAADGVGDRR